jgi:uncharacterized protein YbjT (DUF2867 family)
VHITVLAASGATGHQLALQALEHGHTVTAVARDLTRLSLPESALLQRVTADVHNPESIARALDGTDVVLSGLGARKGDAPGILTAGAEAVLAAGPPRIIWLGAVGTGSSAAAAGPVTRQILKLVLGEAITDKVAADASVLAAQGTVFHAGPLTNGPLSPTRRTLTLTDLPRQVFPRGVSRATVAAAMLEEAETGLHPGQTLVPLSR